VNPCVATVYFAGTKPSTSSAVASLFRILLSMTLFGLIPARQGAAQTAPRAEGEKSRELVVLVHGMARSPVSMMPLAWALKREGYEVMNWGYSSTCCTIAEIGQQLSAALADRDTASFDRIHFVGHSLGTVVIRWLLTQPNNFPKAGNVVMLAPPNQGSNLADRSQRWSWMLKPLPELKTVASSTARTLGVPRDVKIGVIAGEFDGKVSVEETHIEGEAAHVVVPAHHSFLMLRKDVRELTLDFLRNSSFNGGQPADVSTDIQSR
jgi:triacylglycerol lipase